MHEIPPTNELSELRNRVVDLLRLDREQGTENPETRAAFIAWRIAAEKNFTELYAHEGSGISQIRLSIEQAIVLRDAGLYQQAFDELNVAQGQARNEGRRDLFDEIGDMMDVINQME